MPSLRTYACVDGGWHRVRIYPLGDLIAMLYSRSARCDRCGERVYIDENLHHPFTQTLLIEETP